MAAARPNVLPRGWDTTGCSGPPFRWGPLRGFFSSRYTDGMSHAESLGRPEWVSGEMFPFESRFFTTAQAHQMH